MMHRIEQLAKFFGHYSAPASDRLFEWMTSSMMICSAFLLAIWPHSIGTGSYKLMLQVGVSAQFLSLTFGTFGILRMVALVVNGLWPTWGPRLRAIGAAGGAFVWAQMFMALTWYSLVTTYPPSPSMGLSVYFFLMIGELRSCWIAATSVKRTK